MTAGVRSALTGTSSPYTSLAGSYFNRTPRAGVWDAAPAESELLIQADRLIGGRDAVLVIDDTAIPKKGKYSVGVAPQYASALGKPPTARPWYR
jgi:hypothetical protein